MIFTGTFTGIAPELSELQILHKHKEIPVVVGSGMNSHHIHQYYEQLDAFTVGSWFKVNGSWENPIVPERVKLFMHHVQSLISLG